MVSRPSWVGQRVLVTGHTGFKGGWLVLMLRLLGARVAGCALPPATKPSLWSLIERHAGVTSTTADIRDPATLAGVIESFQPEIVFHLAAQSLVRQSYEDPVGTYATNVMGTVHLLESVRRASSVRVVVNITSDKCYENLETGLAYRETDPIGGSDPYSSSKGCAELLTTAYRKSFFQCEGAPALASARAGNVIGGGDWAPDRIIPDIVRATIASRPVKVRNPGAIRPWQHVLEPISGYIVLAERLLAHGHRYAEAWNFGPNEEDCVPVETLVAHFIRLWGLPITWLPDRAAHPPEANFLRLDSSKARSRLGWRPRLGFHKALDWTVDWYRQHARGADTAALAIRQVENYLQITRE